MLAYADSCAAINSYLSRAAAWKLCSSPVRKEESLRASDGVERRKQEAGGRSEDMSGRGEMKERNALYMEVNFSCT